MDVAFDSPVVVHSFAPSLRKNVSEPLAIERVILWQSVARGSDLPNPGISSSLCRKPSVLHDLGCWLTGYYTRMPWCEHK